MPHADPARSVVDIITGSWKAQALCAAVALQIPDHIAAGATTVDELASAANAKPDGIRRLMRLMANMQVFDGSERAGYRLTPVSALLRAGASMSLRDMCLMYGDEFYRAWGAAPQAISTSRPAFDHVFGRPLGVYLRENADAGVRFQRAMSAGSLFFADVPRLFDFSECRTVVDIGGGNGTLLSIILGATSSCRGILFDLPHVVAEAHEQAKLMLDLDRCDMVAGDLFASIPQGADVYLASRILQDWDDDRCIQALSNCREAMGGSGRLLILERVIPDDDSASLPLLWDLHLLMMTGGRERTIEEYHSLLRSAGLRVASVASLPLEMSMLTATRA